MVADNKTKFRVVAAYSGVAAPLAALYFPVYIFLADFYVKNFAGGFSKSNDRANTVVVYPNGIAKKSKNFVLFKVSPKVTKGSTIRVTSKNKKTKRKNKSNIDWNEQIENAMLKISAVLTLWVLVDRVQAQ